MGRSTDGADKYELGDLNEQPEHPAKVGSFHLDAFEVTVGRFRAFVDAYDGTPPAKDAGKHPRITGSGWQSGWNQWLAGSRAALKGALHDGCPDKIRFTWTDEVGFNESHPMSCMTWYEALAFCIWDGGRLPTEAEWEYAAAGGTENRRYPWGPEAPDTNHAVFGCVWDGDQTNCEFADIAPVGSVPAGNGKWGHRDLAGNMFEMTFDLKADDWYSTSGATCDNCANREKGWAPVIRGGNWGSPDSQHLMRAAYRGWEMSDLERNNGVGFRCARDP